MRGQELTEATRTHWRASPRCFRDGESDGVVLGGERKREEVVAFGGLGMFMRSVR
jgi:hypothetical protein